MENDGLPAQVCLQCVHYITRAYSFKRLCERSEVTLRELLGRPTQTLLELKPIEPNIQQNELTQHYELVMPEIDDDMVEISQSFDDKSHTDESFSCENNIETNVVSG